MSVQRQKVTMRTWNTPFVAICLVWLCAVPHGWQDVGGAAMAQEAANPLASYRWQNRVVVLLAPSEDRKLAQQHQILSVARDGLLDRDLVVVSITDGVVKVDGIESKNWDVDRLQQTLDVSQQGFSIVLIGKDGGVKLRSDEPVAAETLFALIDSMPMRKREMREREGEQRQRHEIDDMDLRLAPKS